jgi:DNA-directed RNA polymerase specialized sigma24 family protein
MADGNVSVLHTDFACAACVARLAEADFHLLPEVDAEVVAEHLSGCRDCRLFTEQLDTTREVLAAAPAPERTADVTEVLEQARSALAGGSVEQSLGGLYRIAAALGVDDPDELVQQTLLDAVRRGTTLDSRELIDALIRTAEGQQSDTTESLDVAAEPGSLVDDPDSETAELFYPEFYEDGPDVGRFVDSPNAWGDVLHLAPEDEVATIELFEVTDSAIDELPELQRRLITLVDIEGVTFADAARALHVGKKRAAQALNRARIHVRGAIDNYLHTAAG